MQLKNNTILITGGSSGIGKTLSKALTDMNNTVIICGSSKEKLTEAKVSEPRLITYQCDLSDESACSAFADWLTKHYPALNVLINNAAIVNIVDFLESQHALVLAEKEFQINFFAPLRLIKLLHPVLSQQENATIINITTGLIYAPRALYPFYNATKAALHAFTQTLRLTKKNDNIAVIEVMFPAVDTPWHKGNPPKIAISTDKAVNGMIKGLEKGKKEIRVGAAKKLYLLSRIAPGLALKVINKV